MRHSPLLVDTEINMSRILCVVLLALVVVASANRGGKSSSGNKAEIVSIIEKCLAPVPKQISSFIDPGAYCLTKAKWAIDDGNSKQSLPGSIEKCLRAYSPAPTEAVIQTAALCLKNALA